MPRTPRTPRTPPFTTTTLGAMRYSQLASLVILAALTTTIDSASLSAQGATMSGPRGPGRIAPPATGPVLSGPTAMPAQSPEAGAYTLKLTATDINGSPADAGKIMTKPVTVTWSGTAVTITQASGPALHGLVSNGQLSATSQSSDGTMTITGGVTAHRASGTFTITQSDGNTSNGTFVLNPPGPAAQMKAVQQWGTPKPAPSVDPCGFWCQIKGWFR